MKHFSISHGVVIFPLGVLLSLPHPGSAATEPPTACNGLDENFLKTQSAYQIKHKETLLFLQAYIHQAKEALLVKQKNIDGHQENLSSMRLEMDALQKKTVRSGSGQDSVDHYNNTVKKFNALNAAFNKETENYGAFLADYNKIVALYNTIASAIPTTQGCGDYLPTVSGGGLAKIGRFDREKALALCAEENQFIAEMDRLRGEIEAVPCKELITKLSHFPRPKRTELASLPEPQDATPAPQEPPLPSEPTVTASPAILEHSSLPEQKAPDNGTTANSQAKLTALKAELHNLGSPPGEQTTGDPFSARKNPSSTGESYPALAFTLFQQGVKDWQQWKKTNNPKFYQRALFNIDSALTIDETRSEFWFVQGMLYAEMKADKAAQENALTSFLTAIQLNPQHGRAQFMTGKTLFNLGRFDLAAEQFRFLADKDPAQANGLVLSQLALSYIAAGRTSEGITEFRKLVGAHPQSADIRTSLAVLLKHNNQFAEAQEQLVSILLGKLASEEKRDYARELLNKWKAEARS